MSERADALIRAKLQEGGFRTISKPSDLGSDAIGHNAYGLPGKPVSQLARERAAAKQRPKRGLASFERGDRVHHEKRGKGTVHYVGTAPGLRGRPMTSVVWDGPGGLLGPEPIFHGSGLAKGLRKLKESEDQLARARRHWPTADRVEPVDISPSHRPSIGYRGRGSSGTMSFKGFRVHHANNTQTYMDHEGNPVDYLDIRNGSWAKSRKR